MQNDSVVLCEFQFACDKKWKELDEIADQPNVRFCDECLKPVFHCSDYSELRQHVSEGHCVAVMPDNKLEIVGFVTMIE